LVAEVQEHRHRRTQHDRDLAWAEHHERADEESEDGGDLGRLARIDVTVPHEHRVSSDHERRDGQEAGYDDPRARLLAE
jgi:hypothetical protein